MSQRTIDTILRLSGENEYRTALKNCASEQKTLKSELDLTASAYRNNANSMEAITAKGDVLQRMYEAQQQKISTLAGALENAGRVRDEEALQVEELRRQYDLAKQALEAYGRELGEESAEYLEAKNAAEKLQNAVISHQSKLDAAARAADGYHTQLNKAWIELDKLEDRQAENNRLLQEAESSADGCAHSIDRYGKQVRETAQALDDAAEDARDFDNALDDVDTDGLSFGDVLGAEVIGEAAGQIIESIGEIVEETKEYRRIMASLEQSSQDAGYAAGETAELYGKLNGVLGDTQSAATTTANLQALGMAQGELKNLTDGVIGAWAKYGDSIPIDGLSEAVNHTAKLGEVQGNLADVLEWAGIPVDAFNEQLAACNSTTERADLIARMFAEQGLTQLGRGWQENNRSLIESNNATAALQEQLARLAEKVEPIFSGLTNAAASMLGAINDGLDTLAGNTAANDLAAGMDAFSRSMTAAQTVTATTRGDVESSVFIAEQYVARLDALSASGLTTAQAQQEYASTVELLNGLIPGLNLTINEQTGLLEQSTGSVLSNIDAWKQQSLAKAIQTELTAQIDAQAQAYVALQRAESAKIELDAREQDVLRRLAEAQSRAGNATGAMSTAMKFAAQAASGLTGDYSGLANESIGVTDEMADLERELSEVRSAQSELDSEIATANGLIADSELAIDATRSAYAEFDQQVDTTADNVETGSTDMAAAIAGARDDIMASYGEIAASARESIDTQIGLFDDLSGKCEMTGQEMIAALKSQQQAFNDYADNITLAMERGIDIGLVQKLSDGSQESMQQLAVLVEMSEEEIAELNETFRGVEDAKDALSEGMASVSEEFLQILVDMGKLTEEEAYAMGQQLVDGLIAGVEERAPSYNTAVGNLARGGQYTYQDIQDQHSPSRRFKEFARNDVDGLIVGYEESKPRYEEAAGDLAESGYQSMVRTQQESADAEYAAAYRAQQSVYVRSYPDMQQQAPAADERLYSLLQRMLGAIEAGHIIALDGNQFVGATVGAMDSGMGTIKMLTDRGLT